MNEVHRERLGHVTSVPAVFLSAQPLRGSGGNRARAHPFKNNWDIAERGGGEERGIKKEKEERDREGREEERESER